MTKYTPKDPQNKEETPQQMDLFDTRISTDSKAKDYYDLAFAHGITWVGEKVPEKKKHKTTWRCSKGHVFKRSFTLQKSEKGKKGYSCPTCGNASAGKKMRLGRIDYEHAGIERDIKWVGKLLPKRNSEKTTWECLTCGFVWDTTIKCVVDKGSGCPKCAKRSMADKNRLTEADYHDIAMKKGFVWLGNKVPQRSTIRTNWGCLQGHEFTTSYSTMVGSGHCYICSGSFQKTEEHYHALAKQFGFQWIGDKLPRNTGTKTLWLCQDGHEMTKEYHSIRNGRGCPVCKGINQSKRQRHMEGMYHSIAAKSGYKWVGGSLPKNSKTKTQFLCPDGHIYLVSFGDFKQGSRCTECQNMVNGVRISSQQEWLCDLVAGKMNVLTEGYYADIVVRIDGQPIVIEYDGYHWHKGKLRKDKLKNKVWIEAGWKVLRVKSGHLLPDEQSVMDAIFRLLNGSEYEEIILDDWGE